MRVAEPLQRGEQHAPGDGGELHAADDFAEEHTIGEHRHVPTVLFECGDREHDGGLPGQRCDRRPGQVGKFHAGYRAGDGTGTVYRRDTGWVRNRCLFRGPRSDKKQLPITSL